MRYAYSTSIVLVLREKQTIFLLELQMQLSLIMIFHVITKIIYLLGTNTMIQKIKVYLLILTRLVIY
ncbi:hypothetical protein C1N56_06830 [Pantoea sp. SGAir0175]